LNELLDLLTLVPFVLYAETHYRFKYFFSYLRKSEPEIIFDAPHRIDADFRIPILMVAKDADTYPCEIVNVVASISQGGVLCSRQTLIRDSLSVNQRLGWFLFELDPKGLRGSIEIDIEFELRRGTKKKRYRNDNHRTSSHRALSVYLSPHPLPQLPGVYYGDAHTHSSYTDDQVEFGAPLEPSITLAQAMGLKFFCTTDHSYDLDDRTDTFLVNDPAIPKWSIFQEEVQHLNNRHREFAVLRGEEVTCRNARGKNVHLLLFGNRTFVPGSGDSAERWCRTRSEHSIEEILRSTEKSVSAFAAHPRETVSLLQRLLIGRGRWEDEDFEHAGLTGLQFVNGVLHDGFTEGKASWVKLLLGGKELTIVGGNDSHGNFNRFRQIGVPFLRIVERPYQIFGKMRTGVLSGDQLSEDSLLAAIMKGLCFVTNGPLCVITLVNEDGARTEMGGFAQGSKLICNVQVKSTEEFGLLAGFCLYQGVIGGEKEQLLWHLKDVGAYQFEGDVPVAGTVSSYIRAEVFTRRESSPRGEALFAFTNPIWVKC